MKRKILLISSSTGGHAIPIFYVWKKLTEDLVDSVEIKVAHSGSAIERELFLGVINKRIITGKINRHEKIKNFWEGIKIVIGMWQSFWLLVLNRPNLIFSKGGFVSVPVLFWAKIFGIDYFIHESDSVMGVSNRLMATGAKKVFVAFPTESYANVAKNFKQSGLIVGEIRKRSNTKSDGKPLIYITGGSQGARKLNEVIFECLPRLILKFNIMHQVGVKDILVAEKALERIEKEQKDSYSYFGFSRELSEEAMIRASLVIARAGATTIGEISSLRKPSILIPYKYASDDHQYKNAKILEKVSAAILIKEDNFDKKTLLERIDYLFSDKRNLEVLSKNVALCINTNGLNYVCGEIIKEIKKK